MKKQLISLSLLATCVSINAFAASPVANIQVSGDIKPPTCAVNGLEQNDVIFDYGVISPAMVPQSSAYRYPYDTTLQEVTVTCDAKTYLTFKPTDTYESANTTHLAYPQSTNNPVVFFNLVPVSDTATALGGAYFQVKTSSVDGSPTVISRANDGVYQGTSQGSLNQSLIQQATMTWTLNNENNRAPEDLTLIPGDVFTMTIGNSFQNNSTNPYKTFLTSQDALSSSGIDIANGLDFIGEAVLTFNFGV